MERILTRLLQENTVSGQTLSQELGVTRAAIWKQMEQLRQAGFVIEPVKRQGYRLVSCPDSLMAPVVKQGLLTTWAGKTIVYMKRVDSTNRYARMLAAQGAAHGMLVLADEQTEGRGRRGRGWLTEAGQGIAMSLLLRPQVHPSHVAQLSLQSALAVAMGIAQACGVDARIKWPNDIVVSGRKVSGMLLEMNADEQSVHDVVVGIGINVHPGAIAPEIAATAGDLDTLSGRTLRRPDIVRAVLQAFEQVDALAADGEAFMRAYCARSATLGQRVQVIGAQDTFVGTAQGITSGGALIVEDEWGQRHEVLAADVSVRGLMGYV